MPPRALAALILTQLIKQPQNLSLLLAKQLTKTPKTSDRAFVQELCYGVARWYPLLTAKLDLLLDKPLPKKHTDLRMLALIGLYQIDILHTPAHAAVNATVEATTSLQKRWAKALLNALLQRYLQQQAQITSAAQMTETGRTAHPAHLLTHIQTDWPDMAENIIHANNQRPPMCLRVNKRHIQRTDYLQQLKQANMLAQATRHAQCGLSLQRAVDITQIPGFAKGWVSVQDEAAQLAVPLLDLAPKHRILDACAAPGGKTTQLLNNDYESTNLIAIEKSHRRMDMLRANMERLKLTATLLHADATQIDNWWDGIAFDRILLDAPCSASGIIRRQPDLKLTLSNQRIQDSCVTQAALLDSLWQTLKPGGVLLYVTCSILVIENAQQIRQFLARQADAIVLPIIAEWGIDVGVGRQILPGNCDNMDGFFYARLQKASADI